MPYKHKTPVLGIPFMGKDDTLSAQEERKQAIIIENQLIAAMKGIQSCVFEEGEYRIVDEGKTKSVYLMTTGQNLSFMGIVGGGFCKISGTLKWEGLQSGKKYYLYLKAKENIFEKPTSVRTIVKDNTPYQPEQKATLLAIFDLTKELPELDTLPPGKAYGQDVALHGSDKTNPHGEVLEQDSILLRKELAFEHDGLDGKSKERLVLYNEEGTGVLNKLLKEGTRQIQQKTVYENPEKTMVTNLQSGGTNGTDIKVQNAKKIKAVYVHENADENQPSFLLGQVATKIKENLVRIYNDGSLGIKMRVVIIYE